MASVAGDVAGYEGSMFGGKPVKRNMKESKKKTEAKTGDQFSSTSMVPRTNVYKPERANYINKGQVYR